MGEGGRGGFSERGGAVASLAGGRAGGISSVRLTTQCAYPARPKHLS